MVNAEHMDIIGTLGTTLITQSEEGRPGEHALLKKKRYKILRELTIFPTPHLIKIMGEENRILNRLCLDIKHAAPTICNSLVSKCQ